MGQLVFRFLLGFVGVVFLVFGLNAILAMLPEEETWFIYSFIYLQFFLVSLWIIALAPMLFIKIGLANVKTK